MTPDDRGGAALGVASLGAWLRLVRVGDWWLYHLLPLLGVTYAAMVYYAVPAGTGIPALVRLALSISCVAAYAHLVNDLADAEQDARAGKAVAAHAWSPATRVALSLALLAGAFAVWIDSGTTTRVLVWLAIIAVLQPVYAVRPVRLKERGAAGLLTDALHTHALPTLYCVVVFADVVGGSLARPFPIAVTAWALFVGLRGILYHQRIDEANDRIAGVRTFVTVHGSDRAAVIARDVVFPAELLALAVVGWSLIDVAPVIVLVFVAYGGVMLGFRWIGVWRASFADPAPATPDSYVPLLAFYRSWPALAFVMLLAVRDPRYLVVLTLHVALFARPSLRQALDLWRLCSALGRAVVARVT